MSRFEYDHERLARLQMWELSRTQVCNLNNAIAAFGYTPDEDGCNKGLWECAFQAARTDAAARVLFDFLYDKRYVVTASDADLPDLWPHFYPNGPPRPTPPPALSDKARGKLPQR